MSARSHDASRRFGVGVPGRRGESNRWARSRRSDTARVRRLTLRAHLPSEPEGIVTAAQLEDVWERHGAAAYALACALLDDEAAAALAVRLAMADLGSSAASVPIQDAKHALARHVYLRSTQLTVEAPRPLGLPRAMVWVGQLAQLQRTCVAMCLFGDHTYRETAGLLGLPPVQVAELLTAGLREVQHLAGNRRASD